MWVGRRAAKCDTQPRAQPVFFAFPAAELASGTWQRERIACDVPNVLPFPSSCLKWRLFAPSVMPVRQQLCQELLSSSHAGGSSWVQVRFPSAYRHEAALRCQTKGLAGKMKILLLLYTSSVLFTCFPVMHILISDTENQKRGFFPQLPAHAPREHLDCLRLRLPSRASPGHSNTNVQLKCKIDLNILH